MSSVSSGKARRRRAVQLRKPSCARGPWTLRMSVSRSRSLHSCGPEGSHRLGVERLVASNRLRVAAAKASDKPRMAADGREVPPRGRADMNCINCGQGHAASECRQAKVEKGERPCFTCGKTGHEACMYPQKQAPRIPLKALEDVSRRVVVMCITDADGFTKVPPRRSGQRLGDFIAIAPAPCAGAIDSGPFSWRIGRILQRKSLMSPRSAPRRRSDFHFARLLFRFFPCRRPLRRVARGRKRRMCPLWRLRH